MSSLERPRVDGIASDTVSMNDVLRLDAAGLSAPAIAERLNVSVLEVEYVLRRLGRLKALESVRARI
jgi:DNA-binding NarL/FixJ family response regulator